MPTVVERGTDGENGQGYRRRGIARGVCGGRLEGRRLAQRQADPCIGLCRHERHAHGRHVWRARTGYPARPQGGVLPVGRKRTNERAREDRRWQGNHDDVHLRKEVGGQTSELGRIQRPAVSECEQGVERGGGAQRDGAARDVRGLHLARVVRRIDQWQRARRGAHDGGATLYVE